MIRDCRLWILMAQHFQIDVRLLQSTNCIKCSAAFRRMAISGTINKGLFLYNPYKIQKEKLRIRFSQTRFFLDILYRKPYVIVRNQKKHWETNFYPKTHMVGQLKKKHTNIINILSLIIAEFLKYPCCYWFAYMYFYTYPKKSQVFYSPKLYMYCDHTNR